MVNKYSRHLLGDIQKDKDKLIQRQAFEIYKKYFKYAYFQTLSFYQKDSKRYCMIQNEVKTPN